MNWQAKNQKDCHSPSCIIIQICLLVQTRIWQGDRPKDILASIYYLGKSINCSQDSSIISSKHLNDNICQKCSPKPAQDASEIKLSEMTIIPQRNQKEKTSRSKAINEAKRDFIKTTCFRFDSLQAYKCRTQLSQIPNKN